MDSQHYSSSGEHVMTGGASHIGLSVWLEMMCCATLLQPMLVTLMIPLSVMPGDVSPKQYHALADAVGPTVTFLFLRGGEAYLE